MIIWIGRDSNKSIKLYGSSGAMQIYKKYLEYYSTTPLELKAPRHIKIFYVDKFGKLFCTSNVQNSLELPIWFVKNYNFCKHQILLSSHLARINKNKNIFLVKKFFKTKGIIVRIYLSCIQNKKYVLIICILI
jgi:penicillin-binding protein 1B